VAPALVEVGNANTRWATPNDALGVAMVWTLPASCATGLCCSPYPVGAGCFKRQTARRRPLHLLRRQRRDPPAPRLGW